MSDLQAKISDAIKEHLPQHIGEELRKELDAHAKLKEAHAALHALHDRTAAMLASARTELEQKTKELAEHAKLALREEAIKERERMMDVLELRTKLEAAERMISHAHEVARGLVRNIEYRSQVHSAGQQAIAIPGSGGSVGYPSTQPYSHTETHTHGPL